MARVFATMTGREPLPDQTPLYAPNVTHEELVGLLVPAELTPRWDRIEGERPRDYPGADIGVDGGGVYVSRHPEVLLSEQPDLWSVIDGWRRGRRTIRDQDDEELTCFDLDLKIAMVQAAARDRSRPATQKRKPDGPA